MFRIRRLEERIAPVCVGTLGGGSSKVDLVNPTGSNHELDTPADTNADVAEAAASDTSRGLCRAITGRG